ncbi:HAUS augmin-like complex subunit 8 [Numenius arquata]|uniref:HAUS augmin-like complex subunit 8 n=1 Tax=Numenius arquata TaxID=31919 RepID=UPI003D30625D
MAAEAAAGMSALESDSSTVAEDEEVSKSRRRGKRIVKSRYLQYDKKNAEKDTSNFFSTSAVKSSATESRSVLPQKCKTSAGIVDGSLNQSRFGKGDLQSTLLNGDKISLPDFDLSAISDKTVCEKISESDSACEEDADSNEDYETAGEESDVLEVLESQTLLLTYLRGKAAKNLAEVEKKAEKNLITLCEEKESQQEKLFKLKREILLNETEEKLDDVLDKQMEVLSPLVLVCERFKEQYKSFADSLDATRHELPIKNIHIEGDTLTFLGELQKQLTITQELLTEVTPSYSEESAKACSVLKDLKETYQKLDKDLQRSFTQVQNLAYEVSKEVSLRNQRICEENYGLDVVKHWYFN